MPQNPIQDCVEGESPNLPPTPTSVLTVTSTNLRISTQNFLTLIFNPFTTIE